jgi:uncharacterized membrane protein YozB (DUF420 family)
MVGMVLSEMDIYFFVLMAFLLLGGIACIIISRINKEKGKMSGAFRAIGVIILFALLYLLLPLLLIAPSRALATLLGI